MGLLIKGQWHDRWYDTDSSNGEFVRQGAQFRHWISRDGLPDRDEKTGFKAEPGRYHLFVSLACPWAHRTLIFRKLKGLDALITVSVVRPKMLENGWELNDQDRDNPQSGYRYLSEIYTAVEPDYTGRVTVPVLWDKQQQTIVNNESADIIRMFNSAFEHLLEPTQDYYPAALRQEIEALNKRIYETVNNGVYRAGFATTQAAYEKACRALFDTLDWLEQRLQTQRYLLGTQMTETDWRLFTTLIRFDSVYHGHFKTNLRRIEDYPCLSNYLRDLYQTPGVAETVDFEHIKTHYYASHPSINPSGIVPLGPDLDYSTAHNRETPLLDAIKAG